MLLCWIVRERNVPIQHTAQQDALGSSGSLCSHEHVGMNGKSSFSQKIGKLGNMSGYRVPSLSSNVRETATVFVHLAGKRGNSNAPSKCQESVHNTACYGSLAMALQEFG